MLFRQKPKKGEIAHNEVHSSRTSVSMSIQTQQQHNIVMLFFQDSAGSRALFSNGHFRCSIGIVPGVVLSWFVSSLM